MVIISLEKNPSKELENTLLQYGLYVDRTAQECHPYKLFDWYGSSGLLEDHGKYLRRRRILVVPAWEVES
ncbi:hypothetical protein N7507_002388 [Penicillium longicatenatum]|nr:hypothetical protein N7507_002388 [Penicillium longicatenatum]